MFTSNDLSWQQMTLRAIQMVNAISLRFQHFILNISNPLVQNLFILTDCSNLLTVKQRENIKMKTTALSLNFLFIFFTFIWFVYLSIFVQSIATLLLSFSTPRQTECDHTIQLRTKNIFHLTNYTTSIYQFRIAIMRQSNDLPIPFLSLTKSRTFSSQLVKGIWDLKLETTRRDSYTSLFRLFFYI